MSRAINTLPLNAWTHLAATYGSGLLRIYVNGVLVSTQAVTGTMASSTRPVRIGGNTIWGEYFAGRIDEVKIYNRALSVTEIAADMAGTSTPPRVTITAPAAGRDDHEQDRERQLFHFRRYESGGLRRGSASIAARPPTCHSSGSAQFTNVAAGAHTLNAWLARADQTKIVSTDATAVAFHDRGAAGPRAQHHRASEQFIDSPAPPPALPTV